MWLHVYLGFWLRRHGSILSKPNWPKWWFLSMSALGKTSQITPNPKWFVWPHRQPIAALWRKDKSFTWASKVLWLITLVWFESNPNGPNVHGKLQRLQEITAQILSIKSRGLVESVNVICSASSIECIRDKELPAEVGYNDVHMSQGKGDIGKNVFEFLKARGNKGSRHLCHLCLTFERIIKIER